MWLRLDVCIFRVARQNIYENKNSSMPRALWMCVLFGVRRIVQQRAMRCPPQALTKSNRRVRSRRIEMRFECVYKQTQRAVLSTLVYIAAPSPQRRANDETVIHLPLAPTYYYMYRLYFIILTI